MRSLFASWLLRVWLIVCSSCVPQHQRMVATRKNR
jgi:hypothetical protein